MAWSPDLVELFRDIKVYITSSPVLARYDPDKSTLLKTDWSTEGMGYILMQPANNEASVAATEILLKTGEYIFDITKFDARLKAILFGSRYCTGIEK